MMNKANPYQAYKQQSVMTMTSGEMLTMLYDGALKELSIAQSALQRREYAKANQSLQKVQRIFNYLKATLNEKYDISANLALLYDYFVQEALRINLKKDPAGLEDMMQMVQELRDTYVEADKKARSSESVG